jgi:AbrB family looped-hinge helix DNA binding protein
MTAVVNERGQVTIPKELRDRLGIRPGQVLAFRDENGCLIAVKQLPSDPFDELFGTLKAAATVDELVREMRGEVNGVVDPSRP